MLNKNDIEFLQKILLDHFDNGGYRTEADHKKYIRLKKELNSLAIQVQKGIIRIGGGK